MKYQVVKGLLGNATVAFRCPQCNTELKAELRTAGDADRCPECDAAFRVPGKTEREMAENERRADELRRERERLEKEQAAALVAKRREREKAAAAESAVALRAQRMLDSSMAEQEELEAVVQAAKRVTWTDKVLMVAFSFSKRAAAFLVWVALLAGLLAAVALFFAGPDTRPVPTSPTFPKATEIVAALSTRASPVQSTNTGAASTPAAASPSRELNDAMVELKVSIVAREVIVESLEKLPRKFQQAAVNLLIEVLRTRHNGWVGGDFDRVATKAADEVFRRVAAAVDAHEWDVRMIEATNAKEKEAATTRRIVLVGVAASSLVIAFALLAVPLLVLIERNTRPLLRS